jgi:hypothetical protein
MAWNTPETNRQYYWEKELSKDSDWPYKSVGLEEKVSRLVSMNASLLYVMVEKGMLSLDQAADIVSGITDSPHEWEDKEDN